MCSLEFHDRMTIIADVRWHVRWTSSRSFYIRLLDVHDWWLSSFSLHRLYVGCSSRYSLAAGNVDGHFVLIATHWLTRLSYINYKSSLYYATQTEPMRIQVSFARFWDKRQILNDQNTENLMTWLVFFCKIQSFNGEFWCPFYSAVT